VDVRHLQPLTRPRRSGCPLNCVVPGVPWNLPPSPRPQNSEMAGYSERDREADTRRSKMGIDRHNSCRTHLWQLLAQASRRPPGSHCRISECLVRRCAVAVIGDATWAGTAHSPLIRLRWGKIAAELRPSGLLFFEAQVVQVPEEYGVPQPQSVVVSQQLYLGSQVSNS